jgi:hypothetical protein
MVCPSFWEDYYMLIYTHCWEPMNSVDSHGSLSLPSVMKVMVCHFVSDSRGVMTALIVVLPLIVVVEISLQLHRSFCFLVLTINFVEGKRNLQPNWLGNCISVMSSSMPPEMNEIWSFSAHL